MAWLASLLPDLPGSGIVYTLTVRDSQRVAHWLRTQGIDSEPYYGAMEAEQREDLENRLLNNEIKALVATVALGMGFDKPDLGFVVHYPASGFRRALLPTGRTCRARGRRCVWRAPERRGGRRDRASTSSGRRSRHRRRGATSNRHAGAGGALTIAKIQQRVNLGRGQN